MFIAKAMNKTQASLSPSWLAPALAAGIILSLITQIWLIFTHRFNGDELYYLAKVHRYLQGNLEHSLQSLQVHLFAPLAALPGSEINQLIAGRLAMLAFECVSLGSLYLFARTWSGPVPALLAVLAFATMSLTLVHGASFRADPLVLALILASLALMARAPIQAPSIVAIASLTAIAFLVTVKVIFFAPAFAGIAAWRIATSEHRRRTGMAIAAIGGIAAVATVSLYFIHQTTLQVASIAKSGEVLASAASVTILKAGFLPGPTALFFAAMTSPLQLLLILASIVVISIRLITGNSLDRWQLVAILGCISPLISLLFYRNSFSYFIPTITAPAFVCVAWLFEQRKWNPALLAILAVGMLTTGALSLSFSATHDQADQRTTIEAVHQIFPEPVSYLDGSGMIASFPREGFFMSGWGMAEYRNRAPIFEEMLRERQVPLLLVNSSALEQGLGLGESKNGRLHPEDQIVLRDNYIPHWGPVWVAGKYVRLLTGDAQTTILIPGPYTIEGAPVSLNEREYGPGDTLVLSRGNHRLAGKTGSKVILRWGNHLAQPTAPPPAGSVSGGM